MAKNKLLANLNIYLILMAIILGFGLGHYYPHAALRLEFLGDIFLNALFMLVVPLVVASMVTGISRLGEVWPQLPQLCALPRSECPSCASGFVSISRPRRCPAGKGRPVPPSAAPGGSCHL